MTRIGIVNPTATFSDDITLNSIVLKMTRRTVSFLFMGDANADVDNCKYFSGHTAAQACDDYCISLRKRK